MGESTSKAMVTLWKQAGAAGDEAVQSDQPMKHRCGIPHDRPVEGHVKSKYNVHASRHTPRASDSLAFTLNSIFAEHTQKVCLLWEKVQRLCILHE